MSLPKVDPSITQQIIEISQRFYAKNFLAAADGNFSQRISAEHILISNSGIPKAQLRHEDFAIVTLDGNVLTGSPSSELSMHLAIYNKVKHAKSVIHAHPPIATAWSIAKPNIEFLNIHALSEAILGAGDIPIVPFALPGTPAMAENLSKYLPEYQLCILARHGAIAWGQSLTEAANGIERLEHTAHVLYYAETLGGITTLDEADIVKLKQMRQTIGNKLL